MKRSGLLVLFFCIIPAVAHTKNHQSFYEKIESIKNNLFKLSPEELCTILEITLKPIPCITADQLKNIMNTQSNVLVINVLTAHYHNDCHIKDSINVPLPDLVDQSQSWDRAQKIVVYCALHECDAGEKGCILLRTMGFTDVSDYRGGIKEWYQLSYPTEGPALSEYLHTDWLPSSHREYELYPESIVCSKQTHWIERYQK